MRPQRTRSSGQKPIVGDELAAALERAALQPAQGGSASDQPMLAFVVANVSYNRYTLHLAELSAPGAAPERLQGSYVQAVNVAEPFDETGELDEGVVVLVWPGQGDYEFFCPRPIEQSEPAAASYWARIISGDGPGYVVRRQTAASAGTFQDANGAADVAASNVWELTVDPQATADVPVGAIVRVFEEPDTAEQTRRFFFYPIHAVYR